MQDCFHAGGSGNSGLTYRQRLRLLGHAGSDMLEPNRQFTSLRNEILIMFKKAVTRSAARAPPRPPELGYELSISPYELS